MEIQIQSDYYLTSNKHEYQLSKKEFNKDGKIKWNYLKHHSTIAGVLKSYAELQIKTSKIDTFKELIKKIEEMKELIKEVNEKLEIEVE